ncbi:transposon Ty2-F/Ty2-GR2 Gag-Pol polyprotein [Kluyveromyces marxianus DMKU3-1042]|uniref:Transposon Ty2-F/Ty2-GR2 Gag-Pol polyprotein n=1 Tax=Kluyveromyces marxianus (strain DMKU3-1042 / BCC 29191 / NBRC 104275) TaxID=1003335 RepID=W0T937_KLUMD|nr:transposon Ty2-F/Ty2-GR2 Gag-Pol polyprotein [Kluyveromyces marxianus DMKU3-1042]XP_022675154.1 transposon Ty2-F/Ty2-GR2 Gag-Pol polyprotein [Kluyveromyces marxianus DMKU3-1042]BAO39299.1 transposon Ty2-F/Ty2-GR2 Gag-Pol polyprotein [Kluyveromyces marxianus DMKU3-1042]BAO39301.1 transposon Ty2-F/Ty2-GR2 Gag-Pol polyprotein [Kluyveromyces marxianus DMKU3-1042]
MLDGGATVSVIYDKRLIHNFTSESNQILVDVQQNEVAVKGEGNLELKFKGKRISLPAIYAPSTHTNIISVEDLTKSQAYLDLRRNCLLSKNGKTIAPTHKFAGLRWLSRKNAIELPNQTQSVYAITPRSVRSAPDKFSLTSIHNMFGHMNINYIRESFRKGLIQGVKEDDVDWTGVSSFQCQYCMEGKAKRNNHYVNARKDYTKEYLPFEYLHTDVFGPVRVQRTRTTPRYFIAFIDEVTKYIWTFPLLHKTAEEVAPTFKEVVMLIYTQFNTRVKTIQMDKGSEYLNTKVQKFLRERGIVSRETTVADSKANGAIERQHYTLLNDCRTFLRQANLRPRLWYHAVVYSTVMRNSLLNRSIGTSPRNRAGMSGLSFRDILPFGQPVIVHLPNPKSKLQARGVLGYALHPSTRSYGYIIVVGKKKKIPIDTRNYRVLNYPPGATISEDEVQYMIDRMENNDAESQDDIESNFEPNYTDMEQPIHHTADYFPNTTASNIETDQYNNDSFGLHYGGDSVPPESSSSEDELFPTDESENDSDSSDQSFNDDGDPMSPPYSGGEEQIVPTPAPIRRVPPMEPPSPVEDSPPPLYGTDLDDLFGESNINNYIPEDTDLLALNHESVPEPDTAVPETTNIEQDNVLPSETIENSNPPNDNSDQSGEESGEESCEESGEESVDNRLKSIPIFNGNKHKDSRTAEADLDSLYGGGNNTENNNGPTLEEVFRSIEEDPFMLTQKRPRSRARYRESNQDSCDSGGDYESDSDSDGSSDESPQKGRKIQRVNYVNAVLKPVNVIPLNMSLNYSQAISRNRNEEEKDAFQKAYQKEIAQLTKMNTWNEELIDASTLPKKKILNSMFIFTTKRDNSKKCRLVARGDQQAADTYDTELKANTVDNLALMTVLALTLDYNLTAFQLDISSAYLYADLKEELYIRAPPHMNAKNKVLRLNKSLYGLKQSGANWYELIRSFLIKKCDLIEDRMWKCVFRDKEPLKLIICLFVDDMLVVGNDVKYIKKFISKLSKGFDTKIVNDGSHRPEDGVNEYDILGIELEYKKKEYMKFGMQKSLEDKLPQLGVPLLPNIKIKKVPGEPGEYILSGKELTLNEKEYKSKVKHLQRIVGLASYVGHKFRFDILYYVNILAQHQLYPSAKVLDRAAQLCQYLWDTRDKKLVWHYSGPKENNVTAVSDAAFAGNQDFKSQSGTLYLRNNKPIAAKSRKIKLTCISSTEAEIYAISESLPILRGLEHLVNKLQDVKATVKVKTDSQPSMAIINGTDDSACLKKHIGSRAMRIRDECDDLGLTLEYIPTKENNADVLTKPLSVKLFKLLTEDWIQ